MCINNQICYVNRCDRSCAARNPVQSTVLTPASVVDDNDPRIAHQLSTIHTSHLIATSEATKNLQQSWPARRILESRSSLTAWPSLPYNFLAKKHACICKTALRWEPPAAFQALQSAESFGNGAFLFASKGHIGIATLVLIPPDWTFWPSPEIGKNCDMIKEANLDPFFGDRKSVV